MIITAPQTVKLDIYYQTQRTNFIAAMLMLKTTSFVLPPGQENFRINMLCRPKIFRMHIFNILYHTHSLGRGNSVFYKRTNETQWNLLGERSPQRPQDFVPLTQPLDLTSDFEFLSRCIYDTTTLEESLKNGYASCT